MSVLDRCVFYVFPLFLMKLFGFIIIPDQIQNGVNYLAATIIVFYTFSMLFNDLYHRIRNFLIMKFILLSILLSIIMSTLFWNQDIIRSFNVTGTLLGMFYYLFLIKVKPSSGEIKSIIYYYTFIYMVIWTYGFIKAPEVVFNVLNSEGELDESRGIFRLNVVGRQFLVICFFLCLNQLLVYKQKIYMIGAILCFVFIILQVTRQTIVLTFLIGLIYILLYNKHRGVMVIALLCLYSVFANITFESDSVIGNMVNLSESQIENSNSNDDIRLSAVHFFINDFPSNIFTILFGNGVHYSKGTYGIYLTKISNNYGYYLSDVGYISMVIICGVIGLFLYFFLFVKISFQSVDTRVFYGKLFIIYMLFANIGADWYMKSDGVILICISVYIINKKVDVFSNNKVNYLTKLN